jgi:hypothetical protein
MIRRARQLPLPPSLVSGVLAVMPAAILAGTPVS